MHELTKDEDGYWSGAVEAAAGDDYRVVLDGQLRRPDPASRRQPYGVHEWSRLYPADHFAWDEDYWRNPSLDRYVIYELHVGTFTPQGHFEAAIGRLDDLVKLGVTAVEIMPVSPFPGERNWGYDGVYPYAVQESYGGPDGLKSFVNACHRRGLAVVLDVVYNHLGPEGNYLRDFGPYFTDKYSTPWGEAINYDDAYSDYVRRYFVDTVRQWLEEFRIDALRLDAVHAIFDHGPEHILRAMRREADEVERRTGRKHYLMAETDTNDSIMVRDIDQGGYGLDAQWADDFHHAIHAVATGEKAGYYADFGRVVDVAKSFEQALVYDGVFSDFRHKTVGENPDGRPGWSFVVCTQNHDQVGNRRMGDRLSTLISFEMQKLTAGLLLISPYIPLLFMGQEYGETNPFRYFVSHGDEELAEAVRRGRTEEFKSFGWQGEVPDPNAEETFRSSILDWDRSQSGNHAALWAYHRRLIELRKRETFSPFGGVETSVDEKGKHLTIRSDGEGFTRLTALVNFSESASTMRLPRNPRDTAVDHDWEVVIASADREWNGPGFDTHRLRGSRPEASVEVPPQSLIVFQNKLYDHT